MDKELLQRVVELRQRIIISFAKLKDYKQNKNALIKEQDYAMALHGIVVEIDNMLEGKVDFE